MNTADWIHVRAHAGEQGGQSQPFASMAEKTVGRMRADPENLDVAGEGIRTLLQMAQSGACEHVSILCTHSRE